MARILLLLFVCATAVGCGSSSSGPSGPPVNSTAAGSPDKEKGKTPNKME